jgi:hypothetical protein
MRYWEKRNKWCHAPVTQWTPSRDDALNVATSAEFQVTGKLTVETKPTDNHVRHRLANKADKRS